MGMCVQAIVFANSPDCQFYVFWIPSSVKVCVVVVVQVQRWLGGGWAPKLIRLGGPGRHATCAHNTANFCISGLAARQSIDLTSQC